MQNKYKIAGHTFLIKSIYRDVHEMCEEYISEGSTDFSVETTESDIRNEEFITKKECLKENIPFVSVSDGKYESMAVYAKIAECLLPNNMVVVHGSVVSVEEHAYMFIAKSGTGKSTHTRLWRELLGEKAVMVNDDKPLVEVNDNGVFAYGTPWNGKHRLGNNINVPLKSICILKRGENNTIREISFSEAYPMLVQQTYRVPGRENIKRELELIDKMASDVKFYEMECNISLDAAKMSYEIMHKGVCKK